MRTIRVVGSIDVERTLKEEKINFEPGLLARAHRNILYIDEVNLLPDHIVDLILDAAAYGRNIVEREGVSMRHPARFILVGTMNPEEGELRPQLLDRFALSVPILTVLDPTLRAEIVKRNIEFETHHELFNSTWKPTQTKLRAQIEGARNHIREVRLPDQIIAVISHVCGKLAVDGYRPDIVSAKVARALAALDGRLEVTNDDAHQGLRLALAHRTRAGGLKPPATQGEIDKLFQDAKTLQIPKLDASQSDEKASAQSAAAPQQKSSLRNAFNRLRPKREADQSNDSNRPQRRGLSNFRILSYFFLTALVVRMFFILQFWTFVMLLGFLMLIMFLISLVRKNRGGASSYPQPGNAPKPRGGKATTLLAAFSWPTARKIHGKKIAEGEQLLEQTLPEESSGPRLELDKILIRARWLGRRKGQIGRGRPVSYRNFARGTSDISLSTSVRMAARRGKPFEVRKDDLRMNIREGRIKASMILVLDSSESMIDSLSKVRDAIRAVKKGATRMRDRVGLIVFKGDQAHVLQHPTTNFNLVMQKLGNVGLSDFTPLAAGMLRAVRMARTEQARGYAPLVLVASDGVTNVSVPRWSARMSDIPDPATDAFHMAKIISVSKLKTLIANMAHVTHDGPADMVLGTHLMTRIAQVTKGIYVGFSHRKEEAIVRDMSQEEARPHLEKLIENL